MIACVLEETLEGVEPQDVDLPVAHDAIGDVNPISGDGVPGLGDV
jgi:hypothetical protein